MNLTLLVILAVLNIPLYLMLGKSMFGGWEGFFESIIAMITPGFVSAVQGKHGDHQIGRFTLIFYLITCVATVAAEYHVIAKYLMGIEKPWA